MNQFILTAGGKEYRVKPTAAPVEAAEKRLGDMSLLDALDHVDRTSCMCAILWAGLQKFNHGMTWEKTLSLIDVIIDDGFSINGKEYPAGGIQPRAELALEVLKAGGFFTTEQIENVEAAMQTEESEESTTA